MPGTFLPAGPYVAPGGSGSGVTVHNALTGRGAASAHPISAVTGLQDALDAAGTGSSAQLRAARVAPGDTTITAADGTVLMASTTPKTATLPLAQLDDDDDSNPDLNGREFVIIAATSSHTLAAVGEDVIIDTASPSGEGTGTLVVPAHATAIVRTLPGVAEWTVSITSGVIGGITIDAPSDNSTVIALAADAEGRLVDTHGNVVAAIRVLRSTGDPSSRASITLPPTSFWRAHRLLVFADHPTIFGPSIATLVDTPAFFGDIVNLGGALSDIAWDFSGGVTVVLTLAGDDLTFTSTRDYLTEAGGDYGAAAGMFFGDLIAAWDIDPSGVGTGHVLRLTNTWADYSGAGNPGTGQIWNIALVSTATGDAQTLTIDTSGAGIATAAFDALTVRSGLSDARYGFDGSNNGEGSATHGWYDPPGSGKAFMVQGGDSGVMTLINPPWRAGYLNVQPDVNAIRSPWGSRDGVTGIATNVAQEFNAVGGWLAGHLGDRNVSADYAIDSTNDGHIDQVIGCDTSSGPIVIDTTEFVRLIDDSGNPFDGDARWRGRSIVIDNIGNAGNDVTAAGHTIADGESLTLYMALEGIRVH